MLRRRARVLYSYTPINDDELALEVSDVIEVIDEVEEGWWSGSLKGKKGVFPTNFVEFIDDVFDSTSSSTDGIQADMSKAPPDPRPSLLRSESEPEHDFGVQTIGSSGPSRSTTSEEIKPKPVRGVGLGNIFQDGMVKLKPTENSVAADKKAPLMPKKPPPPVPAADDASSVPKLPPKLVREQARVLFSYEALNDDELTLKEGDVITIITKDVEDKGWWKGEHQGRVGVFPNNFVELCHTDEVQAPPTKPARPEKPPKALQGAGSSANKGLVSSSRKSIAGDGSHSAAMPDVVPEDAKGASAPKPVPPKPAVLPLPDHLKKPEEARKDAKPPAPAPPLPGKKPPLPTPVKKPQRLSLYASQGSTEQGEKPPVCNGGDHASQTESRNEPASDGIDESDFDNIASSPEKLTHLTANRAKVPNRRPPSHLFTKDPLRDEEVSAKTESGEAAKAKKDAKPKGTNDDAGDQRTHARVHTPQRDTEVACAVIRSPRSTPPASDASSEGGFVTRSEFNELVSQVQALREMLDQQKSHYTRLVKNLMSEIDEEKKSRIALQVEVDRLKKITAIV